jgi:hypothetical protein
VERILEAGLNDLKMHYTGYVLLAVFYCCIMFLGVNINELDMMESAKFLEQYISFIGVIIFTPVFLIENTPSLKLLINSKPISLKEIYIIRVLISTVILVILVGISILILQYNGCTFPLFLFYFGILSNTVFLGGLLLFCQSIFHSVVIGYLVPIIYYIIDLLSDGAIFGLLSLSSLINKAYYGKIVLFIFGIVFIVIFIKRYRINMEDVI